VLTRLATHDPSPTVRLALTSALPRLPPADRWQIGTALATHGEDASDRFLPKMLWYGLAPLVTHDVARALTVADTTPLASLADSIRWYLARQPEGRAALAQRIAEATTDEQAVHLLRLLHFSLQHDTRLTMPPAWVRAARRFANERHAEALRMTEELSAIFGDKEVLQRLRTVLAKEKAPVAERRRALAVLRRVGDTEAAGIYLRLLADRQLRSEVIPLLAGSADPTTARLLLELFPKLTEIEQQAALGVLTGRAAFALELLRAVDARTFDRQYLTALQIRQMHILENVEVNLLLEKVWGKVANSSADAQKTIARLRNTYTTAPLWAYSAQRGADIYKKTCANCHPLDGTSVPLGPSLAGSWQNGLDYFLDNIVDPNAVVGENYRMTLISTKSGTVVTGLLDSETTTTIVLRTAEKTITIPKSEVEERKLVNQSLMPTGLLEQLSETETIELLKFLTTKR
jgi:putative heme-binding domain-containing protein